MAPASTTRPEPLLTVRALLLAFAVVAVAEAAAAQEAPASASRVRTSSPLISAAIVLGVEHSPTFRQRLADIEATDGLVYVEAGTCGNSVAACLMLRLVLAGPSRLLRVFVDLRKANGCRLVATIGHELQHAVEVLQDPRVRSSDAMYFLFARIGPVTSGPFETTAAKQTTRRVDQEVCRDHDR